MKALLWIGLLLLAGFGFVRYRDYHEVTALREMAQPIIRDCNTRNNCSLLSGDWEMYNCDQYGYFEEEYGFQILPTSTCAAHGGVTYMGNDREFLLHHHYMTDADAIAIGGKDKRFIIKKYFNGTFNRALHEDVL